MAITMLIPKALEEYKKNLERVDIIHTLLHRTRKLSQKYQLSEVEDSIVDFERSRREYETSLLETYKRVSSFIRNFLLDKIVVFTLTKMTSTILNPAVNAIAREKLQDIVKFLSGRITTNDLSEQIWKKYIPKVKRFPMGENEFEMVLPMDFTSLTDLFNALHPHNLLALHSSAMEFFGLGAHHDLPESLMNTIYTYESTKFVLDKMLPPFESIAYVIGDNHFITFDGRVFTFKARCEYLLASDFRTQSFALLALFSSYGRVEAIKAELRQNEIILYRNGNVQFNRATVQIPWQIIDNMDGASLISVHREEHWIILSTYDGVQIKCSLAYDICKIVLPGHFHGRSRGLLGINDNEPSNDHNLANGTFNDELNVLAKDWAITGMCQENEAQILTFREDHTCQKYFHRSSSPLQYCFNQVKPKPFEEICSKGSKQQHCTVASAYLEICSNFKIFTALPEECGKCSNDMFIDDTKLIEQTSPTVHDIVFIIEERMCMENHKNKLAQIVQQIESADQRWARFGWVGFGGEGIHNKPHIHYDHNEALLNFSSFVRQTRQSFEIVSAIEPNHGNPADAIKFAIRKFPFRHVLYLGLEII
ncbi:unnamed protein product [Thelazia callipaeda]|uniref:VWFD domain-containing protein n=1 Tax=Thelazia callipaeda TaxID=103827 RepID=A0A0N5CQ70_THECL|nr:unnamed protein product [Thelazia callipaeda]